MINQIAISSNSIAALKPSGVTYLPETKAYIARVLTDGGVVSAAAMVDSRVRFLKQQGLLSTLQFEVSANFGVKLDSGRITKMYNLVNLGDATNAVAEAQPIIVTEECGVKAVEFGKPSSPAITYLDIPVNVLRNKPRAWTYHVASIRNDLPNDTATQYLLYVTPNSSSKHMYATFKRNSKHSTADQRNKYIQYLRRVDADKLASLQSDSASTSEAYAMHTALVDWVAQTAEYRINNVMQGSKLTGLFTSGNSEDLNHDMARLYAASGLYGVGRDLLTSINIVAPSEEQITANTNWVNANLFTECK